MARGRIADQYGVREAHGVECHPSQWPVKNSLRIRKLRVCPNEDFQFDLIFGRTTWRDYPVFSSSNRS